MSYPDGMSRKDLIHVGEIASAEDACKYFKKRGDHDWRCCDCARGYGLDAARGTKRPKKEISHYYCWDKDRICEFCGTIETEYGEIIVPPDGIE